MTAAAKSIRSVFWVCLENQYKTSNQTWQMLIHRPTPESSLRVATCDLFTDGQQGCMQSECLSVFTKVKKLQLVLRCVNFVVGVLKIGFNNESRRIASLGSGCMIRARITAFSKDIWDRAILARG